MNRVAEQALTTADEIAAAFESFDQRDLRRRRLEIQRLLEQDGVTYNVGTGGRRRHQPWNLDGLPLVLQRDEWALIERGVVQRAELLNMVLEDLYGPRHLLREGAIAPEIVLGDPQFLRAVDGVSLPGPRQLVLNASDLVRSTNQGWVALGQRTQAPSGAAYALENRRVITRVFPALFHRSRVRRIDSFVRSIGDVLRAAAPPHVGEPGIVVLTPGPMSATAFEHASLAAQLGYPLVEGNDLEVRNGQVWLRTVGRLRRVHVILRRVDASFADPLELRPGSTLGVAGLVDACRTGAVSVVNTLGSGVLENAVLQTLLPGLARRLLGEDLLLPSAQAWWCGESDALSHVLAHLGTIIMRPASREAFGSSIDTRRSSRDELDALRRRIEARPETWVGQEPIEPAESPVFGPNGFERRPTVLRTFTVAGSDGYHAMAGGLARSAPHVDTPISTRTGALAKDVWILGGEFDNDDVVHDAHRESAILVGAAVPAARAAEHLFWLGRYAERAEATVRLLRAVNEHRNEFQDIPAGPGAAALTCLFETLTRTTGTFPGFVGDDATELRSEPHDELLDLLANSSRPGTVNHAVVHMFDAIDVLRDQLSFDTWLVVSSLQRELEDLERDQHDGPDDFTRVLNDLLQGLLALAGVSAESMVRDQAWHFTETGRRIERALQVISLLQATLSTERGAAAEGLLLESVLSSSESIITYRRRYRSQARVANVLDLLIFEPENPRSLVYQLAQLRSCLPELDPAESLPHFAEAHRLADRLSQHVAETDPAALAQPDATGRRAALDAFGDTMGTGLRELSDLISTNYFSHLLPQRSVVTPIDSMKR